MVVVRLRDPWNAAVRELFAESDYAFGILPAHAFASTALQGAPWEEHAFGRDRFGSRRGGAAIAFRSNRTPTFRRDRDSRASIC